MPDTLPLRLSFSLARADALAWEGRAREITGVRRFAFLVWLAAAGGWLVVLPEAWLRQSWQQLLALLPFVAVHWGVAAVVATLSAQRRAKARFPAPVAATLTDRGDSLLWQVGAAPAMTIRPAAIRQVVAGASHVFLEAPPALVIVPVAAFGSPAAAQAFSARWEDASRSALP